MSDNNAAQKGPARAAISRLRVRKFVLANVLTTASAPPSCAVTHLLTRARVYLCVLERTQLRGDNKASHSRLLREKETSLADDVKGRR